MQMHANDPNVCCWGRLSDVCIVTVQPGVFSQSKDVQVGHVLLNSLSSLSPCLERSLNDTAATAP